MTKTRSTADSLGAGLQRTGCPLSQWGNRGQAMVETAIGLVVFVFVTAALATCETLPAASVLRK